MYGGDVAFRDNFRLTRDMFDELLDAVTPRIRASLRRNERRSVIPVYELFAIVLYILAHGTTYVEARSTFGVSVSYIHEVCCGYLGCTATVFFRHICVH